MKNKVMWMVIAWVLVAGVVWTVSAYSTQIWSPIQFVKQLFVTPNGELDSSKATIKLDGTNGRIDAKSIYENGVQVATKSNLNSYATKSALKNYATKSNLNSYATKSALKNYATKSNLNSYATKNALKNYATKSDLNSVVAESNTVKKCNASNVGKHDGYGRTCEYELVTNNGHCVQGGRDGVSWVLKDNGLAIAHFMCSNGWIWDIGNYETVLATRRVGMSYIWGFK